MVAAAAHGKRITEPGDWLWSYWCGGVWGITISLLHVTDTDLVVLAISQTDAITP